VGGPKPLVRKKDLIRAQVRIDHNPQNPHPWRVSVRVPRDEVGEEWSLIADVCGKIIAEVVAEQLRNALQHASGLALEQAALLCERKAARSVYGVGMRDCADAIREYNKT